MNFRRRDYNLGPIVRPGGQQGLMAFGGVFTPAGNGYRFPILMGPNGTAKVDDNYQQYFSQYTTANIPLFDKRSGSMYTIFLGGISLYDYNFATGQLTSDPELPFVDDVTTYAASPVARARNACTRPARPTGTSNGVINRRNRLDGSDDARLYVRRIFTLPSATRRTQTPRTTSSDQVFRVTLVPTA